MREAFCIFEGGGAKGLAHIGALKAAERRNIIFKGVAGASAGAIAAALVSAGYTADELFNPKKSGVGKLDIDLTKLFDEKAWGAVQLFREFLGANGLFNKASMLMFLAFKFDLFVLFRLIKKKGVITTSKFLNFFDDLLKAKIGAGSGEHGRVVFKDLKNLAIVACDFDSQQIKAFSSTRTPMVPVAEAVAASISIPFLFEPTRIEDVLYLDGGIFSNFPAWVFDEERRNVGPTVPTYGFRLVERSSANKRAGFLGFVGSLFRMLISGDSMLETRQIENFHQILLFVQCATLDFDMYPEVRCETYRDGELHAEVFFHNLIGHQDPERMEKILDDCRRRMIDCIRAEMRIDSSIQLHLRCNVIMKTTQNTLRVMYASGMRDDADDRLEFPIGAGACSRAYVKNEVVICDLEDARKDLSPWKMNKYEQALVRPSLRSLLCVPIVVANKDSKSADTAVHVGVLNFDSDQDLLAIFGSDKVLHAALTEAQFVGFVLTDERRVISQI